MNVLIACEYSGKVRRAFASRGHTVTSCDLLPADDGVSMPWRAHGDGKMRHYTGDVFNLLKACFEWDLMIAFPPCTHLCASGARWWKDKQQEQRAALAFVRALLGQNIPRIALENPVGKISSAIRKPDQYIQPWQFGHGETKKTGLWLKGLAPLVPTDVVDGREARIHKLPPSADRWKIRSETYQGIADAMAEQWGVE